MTEEIVWKSEKVGKWELVMDDARNKGLWVKDEQGEVLKSIVKEINQLSKKEGVLQSSWHKQEATFLLYSHSKTSGLTTS